MNKKKLTEKEIIKSLEVCMYDENGCSRCPCYIKDLQCVCSSETDIKAVLNLIKRLKLKNSELKKQVGELSEALENKGKETAEKFASKLENRLDSVDIITHEDNGDEYLSFNDVVELIYEILKEITESKH